MDDVWGEVPDTGVLTQLAATPQLHTLRDAVTAVRRLHRKSLSGMWCEGCVEGWPCRTTQLLNEAG